MAKKKAIQLTPDASEAARKAWDELVIDGPTQTLPPLYDLEHIPDALHWMRTLSWNVNETTGRLTVRSCVSNAITILRCDPRWQGVIAFDEFGEEVVTLTDAPWHAYDGTGSTCGAWTEQDSTRLHSWFHRAYAVRISETDCVAALRVAAMAHSFHPVRDFLRDLHWDGTARVDGWLTRYLRVVDSPYVRAVGSAFLVGLVARVMAPGCKVDTMLVIEGEQGARKSTALAVLAGDAWYLEISGGIDPKETPIQMRRKWLIEVGELASMRKTDVDTFKGFLSRTSDNYRPPYAKAAKDFARHCLFAGTTNQHAYLHDETGGRRFWPVRVAGVVDVDALRTDRAQLLAEAVHLYDAGHPWHLTDRDVVAHAKREQDDRYQEDPWQITIDMWLRKDAARAAHGVTVAQVLADALELEARFRGRAESTRAGAVLRRLGWLPRQETQHGMRVRVYRPQDIAVVQGCAGGCAADDGQIQPDFSTAQPAQPKSTYTQEREGEKGGVKGSQRVKGFPPDSVVQVVQEAQLIEYVDEWLHNPPD